MSFKIFPCNGKIPLIEKWKENASSDPGQIQLWREQFKDKLTHWGIPTGETNHILALDIDHKTNGYDSIAKHKIEIPRTLSQRTQGGGQHFIYKYPNGGFTYGNRTGIYPGIDCRGEGGYIVYYNMDNFQIAEAPDWLKEAAKKVEVQTSQSSVGVTDTIAIEILNKCITTILKAPKGERNNTLNTEAFRVGQLVTSGALSRDIALPQLLYASKQIGLEHNESLNTINSALSGALTKPLTSPFGEPNVTLDIPPPPVSEKWTPKPFTLGEIMDMTSLKRPQLFKDWSSRDIQITTADGGTGKTTLKLFESVCLALGHPFLGFECIKKGKTLFITGEDTARKLGSMIGRICRDMMLSKEEMQQVVSNILVKKDTDLCLIVKNKQNFLEPDLNSLAKVIEAAKEIQADMIVFDPISSFWGSEAALNDMAKAVSKWMMRLTSETDACVEMINHMGKQSSAQKDMSQFAGRGGTGLPSHARVSRVLRNVDEEEYQKMTGKVLEPDESAMICNVNKFSDGSPLFNKPFLIVRQGFLFKRVTLSSAVETQERNKASDTERIFRFIKQERDLDKYPTPNITIAYFQSLTDKLSKERVKMALNVLMYHGLDGYKIKLVDNPDVMIKEKALVITDMDEKEI